MTFLLFGSTPLRRTLSGLALTLVVTVSSAYLAGQAVGQTMGQEKTAYRLGIGDVVEISVAGIPELNYRTTIGSGGTATLPVGDPIKAAGATLEQVRASVRKEMGGFVVQRQGASGIVPTTVPADQVVVQVVEYRPIYVIGDVANPGNQSFRPGMTARQALAQAGGYTLIPVGSRPPLMEVNELSGEIETLRLSLTRERARNSLLRNEAGLESLEAGMVSERAGVEKTFAEIERSLSYVTETDRAAELDHLQDLQDLLAVQRRRLTEQRDNEDEALEADREELARLQSLRDEGLTALPRLVEARRAVTFSSNRFLDTTLELGNLERDQNATQRDIDEAKANWRISVLENLSESELELRQIEAGLSAALQNFVLLSAMPSDLLGPPDKYIDVRISRHKDSSEQSFATGLDTILQPGDVVEIDMKQVLEGL